MVIDETVLIKSSQNMLGENPDGSPSQEARRLAQRLRFMAEKHAVDVQTGKATPEEAAASVYRDSPKVLVKFKQEMAKEQMKAEEKAARQTTDETATVRPASGQRSGSSRAIVMLAMNSERQTQILSSVDGTLGKIEALVQGMGHMMLETASDKLSEEAVTIMREALALDRRRFFLEQQQNRESELEERDTIRPGRGRRDDREGRPSMISRIGSNLSGMMREGSAMASGFGSVGDILKFAGGAAIGAAVATPLILMTGALVLGALTLIGTNVKKNMENGQGLEEAIRESTRELASWAIQLTKLAVKGLWRGLKSMVDNDVIGKFVDDVMTGIWNALGTGFGDAKKVNEIKAKLDKHSEKVRQLYKAMEDTADQITEIDKAVAEAREKGDTVLIEQLQDRRKQAEELLAEQRKAALRAQGDNRRWVERVRWFAEWSGLNWLLDATQTEITAIRKDVSDWWDDKMDGLKSRYASFKQSLTDLWNSVVNPFQKLGEWWDGKKVEMGQYWEDQKTDLKQKWDTAIQPMRDLMKLLGDGISGSIDMITNAAQSFTDWLDKSWFGSIRRFFETLKDKLPSLTLPAMPNPFKKSKATVSPEMQHYRSAMDDLMKADAKRHQEFRMQQDGLSPQAEKFAATASKRDAAVTASGGGATINNVTNVTNNNVSSGGGGVAAIAAASAYPSPLTSRSLGLASQPN
jgi:hypothetical protein